MKGMLTVLYFFVEDILPASSPTAEHGCRFLIQYSVFVCPVLETSIPERFFLPA
jgi:hypothetical protein